VVSPPATTGMQCPNILNQSPKILTAGVDTNRGNPEGWDPGGMQSSSTVDPVKSKVHDSGLS
jgi:hypothetical protein